MAEPHDNPNIMYLINRKGEQISKDLKRCAYNRDPSGVFMLMETEDSGQFIDFNGEKIGPVMIFLIRNGLVYGKNNGTVGYYLKDAHGERHSLSMRRRECEALPRHGSASPIYSRFA